MQFTALLGHQPGESFEVEHQLASLVMFVGSFWPCAVTYKQHNTHDELVSGQHPQAPSHRVKRDL